MPTDPKRRRALLTSSWSIQPISYKQFTNLISGKNQLYSKLVQKNGKEDPLRKTLLIIDEAHKLYSGDDLSTAERPDVNTLYRVITDSYQKSGMDSVRLLLMTATPYTNDPLDLVKLINLCKPKKDAVETDFEAFKKLYLNEKGIFTKKGKFEFLNKVAGIISYLNREFDVRQFAQPKISMINVPLSTSVYTISSKKEYDAEKKKEQKQLEDRFTMWDDEKIDMKERLAKLKVQAEAAYEECKKQNIPKTKCTKALSKWLYL